MAETSIDDTVPDVHSFLSAMLDASNDIEFPVIMLEREYYGNDPMICYVFNSIEELNKKLFGCVSVDEIHAPDPLEYNINEFPITDTFLEDHYKYNNCSCDDHRMKLQQYYINKRFKKYRSYKDIINVIENLNDEPHPRYFDKHCNIEYKFVYGTETLKLLEWI